MPCNARYRIRSFCLALNGATIRFGVPPAAGLADEEEGVPLAALFVADSGMSLVLAGSALREGVDGG